MAAFYSRVPKGVAVCALALAGTIPRPPAAAADAQELPALATWRVRLLSPLKASFNRKGDLVAASVLEPAEYQGSVLEGQVREIRIGDRAHNSYIEFEFLALHMGAKVLPVTAELLSAVNSKGQPGVDENGRQLESGPHGIAGKLSPGVLRRRSGSPRLTASAGVSGGRSKAA